MGFFSSKSSATTNLTQMDERVTFGGQGAALTDSIAHGNISLSVGSDDVAKRALQTAEYAIAGMAENSSNSLAVNSQTINALKESTEESYGLATETLKIGSEFIRDTFGGILNLTDSRLKSADANVQASRDFAAEIISEEQESADDRLIKVVAMMGAGVLALYAIQKGVFK